MEPLISEVELIDVFYKMSDLMYLIEHASNGPIQVIYIYMYHICNAQMDVCSIPSVTSICKLHCTVSSFIITSMF